jgi:hypothetical protein
MTNPVLEAVLGGGDAHRRRSYGRGRGHRSKGSSRPGSGSGEAEVAWSLADAARLSLDTTERNDVFIAIGIGETFAAICLLLDAITRADTRVEARLAARLWTWLDAYACHDDEPRLRRLIRQAAFGCSDESTLNGVV